MRRRPMFAVLRMLAIVALAVAAVAIPASAQDDDDNDEFGAYVYEGTPDDYSDEPVEYIGELNVPRDDDNDNDRDDDNDNDNDNGNDDNVWDVLGDGEPQPDVLYIEDDEDIGLTIEQLTTEPYVLAVHSDEDYDDAPVVAVGAIEGELGEDDTLLIDLEEVDDSGFVGRAAFAPDDDDDDETEVTVGLWEAGAVDAAATPDGTPDS